MSGKTCVLTTLLALAFFSSRPAVAQTGSDDDDAAPRLPQKTSQTYRTKPAESDDDEMPEGITRPAAPVSPLSPSRYSSRPKAARSSVRETAAAAAAARSRTADDDDTDVLGSD